MAPCSFHRPASRKRAWSLAGTTDVHHHTPLVLVLFSYFLHSWCSVSVNALTLGVDPAICECPGRPCRFPALLSLGKLSHVGVASPVRLSGRPHLWLKLLSGSYPTSPLSSLPWNMLLLSLPAQGMAPAPPSCLGWKTGSDFENILTLSPNSQEELCF